MKNQQIPKNLVRAGVIAAAYYCVARISLTFIAQPDSRSLFWAPAGLLLGILAVSQRRDWRWILPLAFLAHFAAELSFTADLRLAAGYSMTEMLGAILGAWLLQRALSDRVTLDNVPSVLGLILLPMLVSNPLSAILGASIRMVDSGHSPFWDSWLLWWTSTSLGTTVITPVVVTWPALIRGLRVAGRWRLAEAVLFSAVVLAACVAIFALPAYRGLVILPLLCMPFLLFMWPVARFGPAGVALASLFFSTFGLWQTIRHRGTIAALAGRVEQNVLVLQIYLAVLICSSLLLAAVLVEQKRVLRAMHESEARYRALVEYLPAGIMVTTDSTVIYVNIAAAKTLGARNTEELVGHPIWEFVHEDFRELVKQSRAELLSSRVPEVMTELKIRRLDGSVIDVEGYEIIIEFDGKPAIQSCIRDITERKRAGEALRLSEERFSKAFHSSPEPMSILLQRDLQYLEVNNRWTSVFGYTRDDVLGRTPQQLGITAKENSQRFGRALEEHGFVREFELDLMGRHGEIRHVALSAEQIVLDGEPCYLMLHRDLTERRRAEGAVRESEERFRQLTENIREVLWMNTPDFDEVLCISPAYETVWGRTRASLLQNPRSFLDSIHPEDRPRMEETINKGTEQGFEIEYRVIRPDGSMRWIRDRRFPIRDHDGRVYRLAGIAEDITERKRGEEQLKSTSEQLRALMADLRTVREQEGIRISREIHDELGSAFTSLRWDLEVIDKMVFEAKDSSLISKVQRHTGTMFNLIDATINVVRRISSELRPRMLDDLGLVEAIEWQLQQFQTRSGITCRFHCGAENLEFDPDQSTAIFRIFQEALTNILRHAKATLIEVALDEDGTDFVLQIKDNGIGFSEDAKSGALSLGLLGMRERAQMIGGKIEMDGGRAQGTTITLRVPCSCTRNG